MKQMTALELDKESILSVVTGSTMYGLNIETSDEDIKNVVKVPMSELITLDKEWETSVFHDPDVEYHSLKKMMKLLNSQNPTVLEMLYADKEFYRKITPEGEELVANRDMFLSQNCYNSFSGYARDQLMRIKNGLNKATTDDQNMHLRFHMENLIAQMPDKYETVSEGGIWLESTEVDHMGKASVMVGVKQQILPLSQLGGMVSEINASMNQYNKVNNRNRKPEKKLAKHAMHLVRLVLEGIHALTEGTLMVSMKHRRNELIAIRNGEMTWDDFFLYADELFAELERAKAQSILPKQTNYEEINRLYKKIQG